tara:strand:- start:63018 stop:63641 length:624 start_codon:yes stop_codon:yes gene_type:complete
MKSKDLSKQDLYESVKTLLETEHKHIHLPQQKLFTLFSIAFQYMLYQSTKKPGAYILRIEDSALADKLARKSKDPSTRKFLQQMMIPRKIKYQKSMFFLDFFHPGSWSLTADVPAEKIKGAIVVKNTNEKPMTELDPEEEVENPMAALPEDYYITSLQEFVPKTVTIALNAELENVYEVTFPFIKKEKERVKGFTLSTEIDIDNIEE